MKCPFASRCFVAARQSYSDVSSHNFSPQTIASSNQPANLASTLAKNSL